MNAQRELVLPIYHSERERLQAELREAVADFNVSTEPHQRIEAIGRVRELREKLKAEGEK